MPKLRSFDYFDRVSINSLGAAVGPPAEWEPPAVQGANSIKQNSPNKFLGKKNPT